MPLNVLDQVHGVSGKNDKLEILKNNNQNKKLADLLDAALNFKRKFFIRKFEMPKPIDYAIDMHNGLMDVLNRLETREVTGHDARDLVVAFFAQCNKQQQTHGGY